MFISQSKSEWLIAERCAWKNLVGRFTIINFCSAIEQNLADLCVAVFGGEMKCRISAVVDFIYISATNQQQIDRCDVLLPDGVMQSAKTLCDRFVNLDEDKVAMWFNSSYKIAIYRQATLLSNLKFNAPTMTDAIEFISYLCTAGEQNSQFIQRHHADDGVGEGSLERVCCALWRHRDVSSWVNKRKFVIKCFTAVFIVGINQRRKLVIVKRI